MEISCTTWFACIVENGLKDSVWTSGPQVSLPNPALLSRSTLEEGTHTQGAPIAMRLSLHATEVVAHGT